MPPTPTILSVQNLGKRFGSEQIFSGVSFQVAEREHVALVGVNGAGKSTVLRIIAGTEEQSEGLVVKSDGARVTYLPQEARFESDRTVLEEAQEAFAPVLAAAERMHEIELQMGDVDGDTLDLLLDEYAQLQQRFETHGGFEMEHRSEEVLSGLGFNESQFDQPVRQLSGGQKTRVALAKALLADPDLLLLDEPTNHLDLAMLDWLEDFLQGWGGACLIVSHDRYFLDRVTTRTLDLSFGRLEDYPAPYAGYLRLREERLARRWKEYEEQQEFIEKTEEYIRRYKAGQRAREARGRQTRLDRLERIERPREHQELHINITPVTRSGENVLRSSRLTVGYPTKLRGNMDEPDVLVQTPDLLVERGDRVALIGPNGGGKTTLLRTLMGEIPLLKGHFEFGTNVQIGYYAQSHEQLPPTGTPLSVVLDAQPMGEESARTFLGRFLFSDDDVFKPIGALSGGERSRLALGLLLLERANFLVLDEPTNHLDVSARESLEEMLAGFPGTLLFVSHDRYFIDKLATRLWIVEDGKVVQLLGNYSDYQRTKAGAAPSPKPEPAPAPIAPKPEAAHKSATTRSESAVRKAITHAEREISKLESRLNEISDALTIAEVDQDFEKMAELSDQFDTTQERLELAYETWETASSEMQDLLERTAAS
ncbi:MAG: ABC-F family ATP-binding cassette domain-containing protein [Thermomicrobiales bacterium]|nr:ABC-F family ATP-binding cassette domain-containing protein [Thermomicrobiales bacterium]